MGCLKRNVIDVCGFEGNHVCAIELNILKKSVCGFEGNYVCGNEAPSFTSL